MKLSDAQVNGLRKFSQAGGHGYGEYAYLSRATAKSLAKKGLVTLSYRGKYPWGEATELGRKVLKDRDDSFLSCLKEV